MILDYPHKYEYTVDLEGDSAPARVVRLVGRSKRVLEIGAGPGSITKILRDQGDCQVTALEIDPKAIKKLAVCCERVHQVDLNDSGWIERIRWEGRFDVVLAADVLEHLYNPLAVLKAMKELVRDRGCIIVSLPHVGHSAVVACLIEEDFEYRDWGLLDRTHIRFFGIKNIQTLFEQAGLKIVHAEFVMRDPEATEFAERWERMPEGIRVALATNPFGSVYQVVLKAVPNEAEGDGISLWSLAGDSCGGAPPCTSPQKKWMGAVKSWARNHMSPEVRLMLRRLLLTK
jgi:2-polyprenyl-3-methyl-5-hydroxy-6-metoxy-1,4-benzoquinol methylase